MDKGVVALALAFYSVVPCCASKMAESICRSIRDGALEGELAPALTIKDSLASPFAFDVFSYILVQLSSHIMAGKFQSCGIVIIALSRSPSSYTGLLKMKGVDIASSKKWIHIVVRETRKVASISIAFPSDPPPMASISIALTTSSPCPTLPSLRLRSSSPKSPPLSYSTFNFKPLTFSISSNVAFNTNIKV